MDVMQKCSHFPKMFSVFLLFSSGNITEAFFCSQQRIKENEETKDMGNIQFLLFSIKKIVFISMSEWIFVQCECELPVAQNVCLGKTKMKYEN